jgi:hypothetical protein
MTNTTFKNGADTGNAAADLRPQSYSDVASLLSLGIAPVVFSSKTFHIGRLDPEQHEPIKELRRQHGKTHAFRFDSRNNKIANIALQPGIEPMGNVSEVPVNENLLLLAEAIEHQLRRWFLRSRTILRQSRPLICLSRRDRLLSIALGPNAPDE